MIRTKPTLVELSIERLQRGEYQPRRAFESGALEELAASIKSAGLLQPIVVRPLGGGEYEIIAGERRWRAAQLAGLQHVSCLVNEYTDEQAAQATAIENINRVDLNPIEEAQAYQRLIEEFAYLHEEVAAAVGKSRAKITNLLRLLKLDKRVQDLLVKESLSEGHGKVIAGLEASLQYPIAKACVDNQWSIRQVTQAAKKAILRAEAATINPDDPNVQALAKALSEHVGSPTRIQMSKPGRGELKIEFHDEAVLRGIFEKLGFKFQD